MHPLVSSPRALAFPVGTPGRRCAISPTATSVGAFFSGLQSFTNVQAHKFARLSGSSHPRISCWAAEAFTFAPITVGCLSRAANMLTVQNRAIDGEGTSTLLDQQLCRLLRSHRAVATRRARGARKAIPQDICNRVLSPGVRMEAVAVAEHVRLELVAA